MLVCTAFYVSPWVKAWVKVFGAANDTMRAGGRARDGRVERGVRYLLLLLWKEGSLSESDQQSPLRRPSRPRRPSRSRRRPSRSRRRRRLPPTGQARVYFHSHLRRYPPIPRCPRPTLFRGHGVKRVRARSSLFSPSPRPCPRACARPPARASPPWTGCRPPSSWPPGARSSPRPWQARRRF